jgi:hypothetical protein
VEHAGRKNQTIDYHNAQKLSRLYLEGTNVLKRIRKNGSFWENWLKKCFWAIGDGSAHHPARPMDRQKLVEDGSDGFVHLPADGPVSGVAHRINASGPRNRSGRYLGLVNRR